MSTPVENKPAFNPVLPLWTLVLFGIAFVGPTAPFTFYGIGSVKSHGHLPLVYLIALVAMSFTAFSYGKMAAAFPEAGSAYAYASHALHPMAGHITGWVIIVDYFMLPLISFIIIGVTAANLVPQVPYAAWVLLTGVVVSAINLRGIEMTTRATTIFNIILVIAMTWFVTAAVRALLGGTGHGSLISIAPFYNPTTFSMRAVMATTPVAVLSFLGFDGISTLAEDSHNPRRNIWLSTVITCFVCGLLFILQTYLGQLVWPDYSTFSSVETAFMDIGRRIGGAPLGNVISALVMGQAFMSAITSQASGSRVLFGMARDGRLPMSVFGYLHPSRRTPVYSLMLLSSLEIVGALLLDLDQSTQLVNYGAGLGFISVNISVIGHYYVRRRERSGTALWTNLIAPAIGFVICLWIFVSLSRLALILGGIWTLAGIVHVWYLHRRMAYRKESISV